RPRENVRIVSLFDPRLVDLWPMGAVHRDVENPVADRGLDTAPVSHAFSIDSCYRGSASSRIWMLFVMLRTAGKVGARRGGGEFADARGAVVVAVAQVPFVSGPGNARPGMA